MYGLSVGVSNISSTLPRAAYALLSGLNAATVGSIALAAVELSEKAITDRVTRTLVFFGGAAGMLYNALWYFPLLMFVSGCVTVVHDYRWLRDPVTTFTNIFRRSERQSVVAEGVDMELPERRDGRPSELPITEDERGPTSPNKQHKNPQKYRLNYSWKVGMVIIGAFLASFTVVMAFRGVEAIRRCY